MWMGYINNITTFIITLLLTIDIKGSWTDILFTFSNTFHRSRTSISLRQKAVFLWRDAIRCAEEREKITLVKFLEQRLKEGAKSITTERIENTS
jgi:hypothetical protein